MIALEKAETAKTGADQDRRPLGSLELSKLPVIEPQTITTRRSTRNSTFNPLTLRLPKMKTSDQQRSRSGVGGRTHLYKPPAVDRHTPTILDLQVK